MPSTPQWPRAIWLRRRDGLRVGLTQDEQGLLVLVRTTAELEDEPRVWVNDLGITTFELSDGPLAILPGYDERAGQAYDNYVACPHCESGAGLVYQEYVYSTRPIDPELRRTNGQTCFYVTGPPDESSGLACTTLMPPFWCRTCGRAYDLPEGVTFDWR
jgi:hypothetical protein